MNLKMLKWPLLLCCAVALLAPRPAHADAPGTRGDDVAPQGSSGGAGDWSAVRALPPPDVPAVAPAAMPKSNDWPLDWLGRELATGNWVMDAGLGIASGAIGTMNQALTLGLQQLIAVATAESSCAGGVNIITCTPPELFLDSHRSIGSVVHTIWGALTPIAISLIGLLFTLRIGRLIAEGPRSLAAEGKPLVISFVLALLFVKGSDRVLRVMMSALNEFHGLLLRQTTQGLLEQMLQPSVHLNFGLQITTLVMLVTVFALAVKALMRMVQLTILISIAPLMGALLMDRSTSPRFGQWLAKLLDTLLQQTAWVFFLWIGSLFFGQALLTGQTQVEEIVIGRILATVVFGMAIGGESALAGIAGAGAPPSGLVGTSVAALARGRMLARTTRWLSRAVGRRESAPAAAAQERGREPAAPSGPAAAADPARSAAARRAGTSQSLNLRDRR
ncbi:MAG: type IV secretion system protein [Chloroflexota bacterium]